jgi:FkbM family methyltransferase
MAISFLKSLLKSSVQRLGFDLVKKTTWSENLNGVVLAIDALLGSGEDFFFVQIGAHDGVSDDPIHDAVVKHQLNGLLVEPLPDKFGLLCENYSMNPNLTFENCAIAEHNGPSRLFRPSPKALGVSELMGLSSFDRGHLIRNGIPEDCIEEVSITALTFDALLQKHEIDPDRISLLQIDTEGFDFEIIKMSFVSACLPKVIHFEHIQLSFSDLESCYHILTEKGYRFAQIGINTLAVQETAF